jgi:hypothetical protein
MLQCGLCLLFRINFDVACNMDFHRYPVDEQYCQIKFESFGFQSNQVREVDEDEHDGGHEDMMDIYLLMGCMRRDDRAAR